MLYAVSCLSQEMRCGRFNLLPASIGSLLHGLQKAKDVAESAHLTRG